ncbi:Transportin-3-like 1 [Homarus americanus]|uniref:Transportin-3-like 1 n=1 Tax=Homarus americanus TaxID=6706 RepID=A0A8J5TR76_HOMAM|nr:Transportin-3-like 1 [Homarus americanus]
MEVDINEVLAAISTLYDAELQDKQKHDQASKWLGQLQRSVQAWKVADQLLHAKRDVNSCFFAAQTLRTKIQGIATQLCVALADLALHMASWEDPIVWAQVEYPKLGAAPGGANSSPRRTALQTVAHVGVSTEGATKESTHLKALRCLASWFNIHTEEWVMLTNTCLVGDILNVVRNPQVLHEIATDCVCSAMIMLEAERIQPLAEVAEITFNFWYKLSEVLYRKNCDNVNEQFKPYVERLIEALYRHCQIEPDHESILVQQDDFYEFRERVQELIKDVVFICGSKLCFQQMAHVLQSPDVTKNWNLMEAALFIMQSVAKNLVPEESEVVPPILEGVLSQPDDVHLQVAFTSVQLLAELNEWIACHPNLLPLVLQFLTKRLPNKHLATVAAKALDAVCQSCRDHIEQHFDGLMHIIASLDSFSISNEAVVGLLKGVASILGRFPRERIKDDMKKLCLVQISYLQKIIEENLPIEKNTKNDPVVWLDRLAAIFRNVWPTLSLTFQRYSSDLRVMEHCCRCLRFAVRCVHQQSAPLLSPLVEQIISVTSAISEHSRLFILSCFLYLGSILVDEYASEVGCVAGLLAMLEAFTQPTFVLLTQPNGFRDHPDTVDDWFRLCARFLQRAPVPFLQCSALNTILECGLQACMLDHKEANAAVLKFFQGLVEAGRKDDDRADFETRHTLVINIFNTHGESLIGNLVTAAVFILPQYMHHDIMQFDRPKFCLWLEAKLKVLPTKNSGGVEAITRNELVEFHKAVTQAERTKEITRALVDFSRFFS